MYKNLPDYTVIRATYVDRRWETDILVKHEGIWYPIPPAGEGNDYCYSNEDLENYVDLWDLISTPVGYY